MVNRCLNDVLNEYIEAGDSLIQGLYADEFVATQTSPPTHTNFPG